MKRILATLTLIGAAHGAFAQGTVLFDNDLSGLVTFQLGPFSPTVPAYAIGDSQQNYGGAIWHVALLFNPTPGGGIPQSQLTDLVDHTPNEANNADDGYGSFEYTVGGKEAVITTPSGSGSATFEVVSWLGTATTWAGALAGGGLGIEGEQLVEFTAKIANPNTTPPGIPSSVNRAGQWDGNVIMELPETSTLALGGLGVAMLFLFRRRANRPA